MYVYITNDFNFKLKMLSKEISKYFNYDDRLRRIVSRITGILILGYNVFSGILLVSIISRIVFGILQTDFKMFIIYFVSGIFTGILLLKLIVTLINLFIRDIGIEDYSYLRLVLFVSVIFYFLILIIFSLTQLYNLIEIKLLQLM